MLESIVQFQGPLDCCVPLEGFDLILGTAHAAVDRDALLLPQAQCFALGGWGKESLNFTKRRAAGRIRSDCPPASGSARRVIRDAGADTSAGPFADRGQRVRLRGLSLSRSSVAIRACVAGIEETAVPDLLPLHPDCSATIESTAETARHVCSGWDRGGEGGQRFRH